MIKLGNNNIGKVYLGSNAIGKAYLGSNLVYQSGSPAPPSPTSVSWLCNNTLSEYIDTGIKPDNTTIIEVTYQDFLDTSGFMFGSRAGVGNAAYAFSSNGSNQVRSDCMHKNYYSSTGLGSHTVMQTNASCKIDGSNIAVFDPLFTGNNYNIYVFGLNNAGSVSLMIKKVKISAINIKKGGDYVLKLVPRLVNGEGVFVDTLSGTIFRNQGTGAFTWE